MVGQVGQWDNYLKINGLSAVFCPIGLGQCGTMWDNVIAVHFLSGTKWLSNGTKCPLNGTI